MPKEILIIGGGVAGLAAASRLRNCEITLLEARDRFGGRILSTLDNNQLFELGAEFVHGQSKSLLKVIDEAGLKTVPASELNRVAENGEFREVDVWEKFGKLIERVDPKSPDQSFLAFLNGQFLPEPDRGMMLAFATGFNAAHADRLSTHSLLRAEYAADQMGGDKQSRIVQGYGALVEHLLSKVQENKVGLVTHTVVREIHWQSGSVEVDAIRNGEEETFSADALIVTLPLGVLKAGTVKFQPPLIEKQEAMNGLEFGNVVKITLAFRDRWWNPPDFGFVHALEESIPTWWTDPRGPILTGWAGGAKADQLIGHDREKLAELALDILARVFSRSKPDLRDQLVIAHFHNWANDEFTRGAYSYIPVNGLTLPKVLGAPVDNTLFFAGEATATDAQMGTVFAALDSGYRAADEVNAMLIAQSFAK